jgi:undecaprenyl phosphate-alpha-L-ara4FN deformylase
VLATPGVGPDGAVAHLLRLSESPPPTGHVYTLRGEMEGLRHAALFESLLRGWQAQGYRIVALRDYVEALDVWKLPRHNVLQGHVAGRGGTVALQGGEFLA